MLSQITCSHFSAPVKFVHTVYEARPLFAPIEDCHGMITKFQEKPEPGTEFSNLINAGCYLLEREVLKSLSSEKHSMERAVFPEIAKTGKLAGLEFKGYFVDAGTPSSFIEAVKVCISNKICFWVFLGPFGYCGSLPGVPSAFFSWSLS